MKIAQYITKIKRFVSYCTNGVWSDPSASMGVRIIKTINLAAKSFLDRDLQTRSMSLTYSTVLAIVPAFALLLAIGRGFGLQDLMTSSIYAYFPSQTKAISTGLTFVDSYLKEASSGVFVGVGIVFLLWTVISLMSSIETAFNQIWDIKPIRTVYQKFTDYLAIILIIPILIICSSGLSIFMASTVQERVHLPILTPLLNTILEMVPFFLVWVAFSISLWMIPNTKVNFKYACVSGAICAVAFQVLQMLFVSGQIYVSKYNAIYGSFAFLPLLLIWLQLSWLIVLIGCVLTYSLQNIFTFDFLGEKISEISRNYYYKLSAVIMAVVVKDFQSRKTPPTLLEISNSYDIPIRLANHLTQNLLQAGLLYQTVLNPDKPDVEHGYVPAEEVSDITLRRLFTALDTIGHDNFIPRFRQEYGTSLHAIDAVLDNAYQSGGDMLVADIQLPSPAK